MFPASGLKSFRLMTSLLVPPNRSKSQSKAPSHSAAGRGPQKPLEGHFQRIIARPHMFARARPCQMLRRAASLESLKFNCEFSEGHVWIGMWMKIYDYLWYLNRMLNLTSQKIVKQYRGCFVLCLSGRSFFELKRAAHLSPVNTTTLINIIQYLS